MSRGGSYRPLQPTPKPCYHCEARVFVVKIGVNWVACDVDPAEDGTVVVLADGTGDELTPDRLADWEGRRFRVHYRRCPTTKAWRRKRGIPEPAPQEDRR